MPPVNTPTATYRLQLNHRFTFADAARMVPYLKALGVSHLYCSPIFTASPGSLHGYDVLDHGQINPELGGLSGLYDLATVLRENGLGIILDIVPNHVGLASGANPWWQDVLRNGQASRYAQYFDIDWEAQPQMPSGVLVFPIVGRPFGQALESGELRLVLEEGEIWVRYFEHRFPLSPATLPQALGLPPLELRDELTDPFALTTLVETLEALPSALPDQVEPLRTRLSTVIQSEPAIAAFVTSRLALLNGEPGNPASFDELDALLQRQHYRLAYWRVSAEELNYRRFFDVNDLAAIRVERPEVFEGTHRLVLDLVRQGIVNGLRVDHIDGLYDPMGYLQTLREALAEASPEVPVPVWVEKILEQDEALPDNWPVQGTTGYEFLAAVEGLFIDPSAERAMTQVYQEFTGSRLPLREVAYTARRAVAEGSFAGEINVLAMQLYRIAQRNRTTRDITLGSFRRAITALLACFPVYRSYLRDGEPSGGDHDLLRLSGAEALRRDTSVSTEAIDFLSEVLLLESPDLGEDERIRRIHFRRRFQQISGPVMAKGWEDTTFYRYNRLLSLNEVGNSPARFGASSDQIHRFFASRAGQWPLSLSAASTHDTKRGEDVRARLDVLTELPALWRREVRAWARMNLNHRVTGSSNAPDPFIEYYIYQTLVGSWPPEGLTREYRLRMAEHLRKAIREAKIFTSWTSSNQAYEEACEAFLFAILDRRRSRAFVHRIERFVARLLPAAALNAAAALILRCTAPGIPDVYQGSETGNLSLTDPDNRRPPDPVALPSLLAEAERAGLPAALDGPVARIWLTRQMLHLRQAFPAVFEGGRYCPLSPTGLAAGRLFAFVREHDTGRVAVVVPRLVAGILDASGNIPPAVLGDTALALPPGTWRDVLTNRSHLGGPIPVANILSQLPLAVLVAE